VHHAKNLLKKEYIKIIIAAIMVLVAVLGLFFILQLAMNTKIPFLILESASMCVSEKGNCDGWSHPFDQTLHVGDLLLIQGINPTELNTNYPNSDIIVFNDQTNGHLIVHRIVNKQTIDNTTYFKTKGDASGSTMWPDVPTYYDDIPSSLGVPQSDIVGRVVLRVPWVGGIVIFLKNNPWGLWLIIALILSIIAVKVVGTGMKKRDVN
jgi:hypothetical protein